MTNTKIMKNISITLLLVASAFSFAFSADVVEDISTAIKAGNSKGITNHFIDLVDLKVIEKEDEVSKQQAEMILKGFFNKHPVKSFTIMHKSTPKGGSQYTIGSLETTNGTFRIYFLSKTTGEKTLIQQFTIENENE